MNYQELIGAADLVKASYCIPKRALKTENPNHHLWNNHGTWWINFTLVHRDQQIAERVRLSLETRDNSEARIRRDELFAAVECQCN